LKISNSFPPCAAHAREAFSRATLLIYKRYFTQMSVSRVFRGWCSRLIARLPGSGQKSRKRLFALPEAGNSGLPHPLKTRLS